MTPDTISRRLCADLEKNGYKDQLEVIFDYGSGDIAPEFLGFMNTYYHLSKIISRKRTIIDLGCAYGFQAYYFRNHRQYVGVDIDSVPKLKTPNSKYFHMDIDDFIDNERWQFVNPFAICNYVPCKSKLSLRMSFEDLFVFYVSSEDVKHLQIHPHKAVTA